MSHRNIRVTAFPKSRKEKIVVVADDRLECYVREPAEHNLANTRIRELVAQHCDVPVASVRMETGHRSRKKVFTIT